MTNDLNPAGVEAATIRICPERDGPCPHGMDCPYVIDRYSCSDSLVAPVRRAPPTASLPQPEGETAELVEELLDWGRQEQEGLTWAGEHILVRAADALTSLTQRLAVVEAERDEARKLNNKYAWERDKAREERDAAERRSEAFWKPQLQAAEAQLAHAREAASALSRVLSDIEFMVEGGHIPNVLDDVIYANAREALRALGGGK